MCVTFDDLVMRVTLRLDTEQGDALGLSHAVAQLVQLLRTDNNRCDMRAQRLQVTTISSRAQIACVTSNCCRSGGAERRAVQGKLGGAAHGGLRWRG